MLTFCYLDAQPWSLLHNHTAAPAWNHDPSLSLSVFAAARGNEPGDVHEPACLKMSAGADCEHDPAILFAAIGRMSPNNKCCRDRNVGR